MDEIQRLRKLALLSMNKNSQQKKKAALSRSTANKEDIIMEENHDPYVEEKNKKETMLSVDENVDHRPIASKSVLPVIADGNSIVEEHEENDGLMKENHAIADRDKNEFNNNQDNDKLQENIALEVKQM